MSDKFSITIAPLKIVYSSIRQTGVLGGVGLKSQTRYEQVPKLYVVDNSDILPYPEPGYIGESKKKSWLTGWISLDLLAEKHPEDEFLQRCLDPKLRFENDKYTMEIENEKQFLPRSIAEFQMVKRRLVMHVRIVSPAKLKYRWKGIRAKPRFEPYIAKA